MRLSTGLAFLAGLSVGCLLLVAEQRSHSKQFAAYQAERIARDGKTDAEVMRHGSQLRSQARFEANRR